MFFGTLAPDLFAGRRVERVEPASEITEKQNVPAVDRRGHDRRTNRSRGLKRPLQTAGVRAQCVNNAARAADEDLVANDRGLGERGDVTLESKGPLQFQLRDLFGCQPGERCWSEARVGG